MKSVFTSNDLCCRRGSPRREFSPVPTPPHRSSQIKLPDHTRDSVIARSYMKALHEDSSLQTLTESVERLVVEPVIRAAPWDAERLQEQEQKPQVCLLLISESDVCRSVLAAASLRTQLAEAGLATCVELATCGTRPYNVGEGPDPAAAAAAEALGLQLPADHVARLFDPAVDIVSYDLLLVMDKFTAGDVLREVSSFDLINRTTQFSYKVRRLGEFITAPVTPESTAQLGGESEEMNIEDPLYGNVGGEEEEQAVLQAARSLRDAARGVVAFLQELQQDLEREHSGDPAAAAVAAAPLGPALRSRVRTMGPTSWLVPPMLSRRVDPDSLPKF